MALLKRQNLYLIPVFLLVVVFMIGPLLSVGLLPLAALGALWVGRLRGLRLNQFLILTAIFVGYAIVSSLWSIDPSRSMERGLRLVLEAACAVSLLHIIGSWLPHETVLKVWWTCVSAFMFSIIFIAVDGLASGVLTDGLRSYNFEHFYNRSGSILAIVVPILLLAFIAQKRWTLCIGLACVSYLGLIQPNSSAPVLIAFVALISGLATYVFPRLRYLLIAGVVSGFVFGPMIFGTLITNPQVCEWTRGKDLSIYHRLTIWAFTADKIVERPIFGWGLDAVRAIPGGQALADHELCPHQAKWVDNEFMPLHPHNGVMHAWVELGLIGASLYASFLIGGLFWFYRHFKSKRAQAVITAGAMGYFCSALLSFGLWQGWWVATFILSVSFLVMTCRVLEPEKDPKHLKTGPVKPSQETS